MMNLKGRENHQHAGKTSQQGVDVGWGRSKMIFDKMCTCKGTGRNCALNGMKAICTDFETGLWRAYETELHKHQR